MLFKQSGHASPHSHYATYLECSKIMIKIMPDKQYCSISIYFCKEVGKRLQWLFQQAAYNSLLISCKGLTKLRLGRCMELPLTWWISCLFFSKMIQSYYCMPSPASSFWLLCAIYRAFQSSNYPPDFEITSETLEGKENPSRASKLSNKADNLVKIFVMLLFFHQFALNIYWLLLAWTFI